MPEQKEIFFVGIREPTYLRRQVLSCSKDVIASLKKYEQFRYLRREKAENIAKIRKLFDELSLLNNKLKQAMPKTNLRAFAKSEPQRVFIKEQKPSVQKRDYSALDKLEQELVELESKLERLK